MTGCAECTFTKVTAVHTRQRRSGLRSGSCSNNVLCPIMVAVAWRAIGIASLAVVYIVLCLCVMVAAL